MKIYLNDISIDPQVATTLEHWAMVSNWLKVANKLSSYGLTKIRVPKGFKNLKIAGGSSFSEYFTNPSIKTSEILSLKTFLGTRCLIELKEDLYEVEQNSQLEKGKYSFVALLGKESELLSEADFFKNPAISFSTNIHFLVAELDCVVQYYLDGSKKNIGKTKIINFINDESFDIHQSFLVEVQKKIKFLAVGWDPKSNPIWNIEATKALLSFEGYEYQPVGSAKKTGAKSGKTIVKNKGKNAYEKQASLLEIGRKVAVLNGWKHNKFLSSLNSSDTKIREIYESKSGTRVAYLSIDVERDSGEFELCDHSGDHVYAINFLGKVRDNSQDKSHRIYLSNQDKNKTRR